MKMKKVFLMLGIVLLAIPMAGCWNYREIDSLAIVSGFAIDQKSSGAGYHLTFETLDESGGSNGGNGQTSIRSKVIETDGKTIFGAVRNALKRSDKKLYFGDCKVVVISPLLAKKSIIPLINWINRDSEPRLTLDIFVSKGEKASDVIDKKSPTNPIASYALDDMLRDDSKTLSKTPYVQLYKLNDMLYGQGESLILPVLNVEQNQSSTVSVIDGTAVFKKEKFLGFLDSDESEYLLFVKNQISGGLLTVNEHSTAPNVALEIKHNETKISPVLTGTRPRLMVNIRTEVDLGELETFTDYDTESGIRKLENDASRLLDDRINQLILKVKNEYNSDIFGFGASIYRENPVYWNKIKKDWDKIFRSLDIEVHADVRIKNTAKIKSGIEVGD